jgi:FkbM family methyltransferase
VLDYSQYGQALLLDQLITPDIPRVLIDIGANDGICGSNSRSLLQKGWAGVLVEPLPAVFEELVHNSRSFKSVQPLCRACSSNHGAACLRIGKDGVHGQMSSLSDDAIIARNLAEEWTEVETTTLAQIVQTHSIPLDYGVLLIDTEGWDLEVLRGFDDTRARPRIIVTEDLASTNEEKYRFLQQHGYELVTRCAADSFWVNAKTGPRQPQPQYPIHRLPDDWHPRGFLAGTGRVMLDSSASLSRTLAGWAFTDERKAATEEVFICLRRSESSDWHSFQAWRTPRRDVAEVFKSQALLFSGFRVHVDVPDGLYEVRVVQQEGRNYTDANAGSIELPVPFA